MKKTPKQLERYFKGISCHRRIEILDFLSKNNGATLDEIASALKANFKTIHEHTKRLYQAGLINKNYKGRAVAHSLSLYGQKIHKFISNFK
jgi:DNA-binding transcriptional ArsR family regulator